jgi:hypothetical protein
MLYPRATLALRFSSSGSMATVPTEAPNDASRMRTRRDHRVVMALLLVAVIVVLFLAAISVRATIRLGAVRERVGGTLNRASLVQMEFHTRHRRFALWDELEDGGLRLPSGMNVEASSATPSHWYLRLRDIESGTTCDRVGLLTDPPGRPVTPSCQRSE